MTTIPLAKGYNRAKITYPGYLSVKIDGVPIRCDVRYENGERSISLRTRQDKENFSALPQFTSLVDALIASEVLEPGDHTFVAEVVHPDFPAFKDSSGIIRRQTPQAGLVLNIFDYYAHAHNDTFDKREAELYRMMCSVMSDSFRRVQQMYVQNAEEFDAVREHLLECHPDCEGLVYRSADAQFKPGMRHWDYQKILVKPTVDLRVHSYEEATCGTTGVGKGMVGRINCHHPNGDPHGWDGAEVIGVGPGRMTHAERKSEWEKYHSNPARFCARKDRIIQVEYKKDPSYKALREPTFQCWRPDKSEESYD